MLRIIAIWMLVTTPVSAASDLSNFSSDEWYYAVTTDDLSGKVFHQAIIHVKIGGRQTNTYTVTCGTPYGKPAYDFMIRTKRFINRKGEPVRIDYNIGGRGIVSVVGQAASDGTIAGIYQANDANNLINDLAKGGRAVFREYNWDGAHRTVTIDTNKFKAVLAQIQQNCK